METIYGVIQLSGISGGEGDYIGVVSTIVTIGYTKEYSDLYDITHIHTCSSLGFANQDCHNGKVDINNEFFMDKRRSGHVLDSCHYSSMDKLKNYLISK